MGKKVASQSLCDQYYMLHTILATENSEDPKTKVGSCLVDKNNNIIGCGYNRAPRGFSVYMNDNNCWNSESDVMHKKNTFVLHSELACILEAYKNGYDLKDGTLYVTLFPCNECAKIIIESGIKNVCYLEMYSKSDKVEATKTMFDECNVTYRQFGVTEKDNIGFKQSVIRNKEKIKQLIRKRWE